MHDLSVESGPPRTSFPHISGLTIPEAVNEQYAHRAMALQLRVAKQ